MLKFENSVSNIVIIGCGGVASWMMAPLVKLLNGCDKQPDLVFIDGDTIEERNLERQWFDDGHIGMNKAEALSSMCKYTGAIYSSEQYFTDGMQLPVTGTTLFLGCADNHAARRAILDTVDRDGGFAIIAGNEYTEAEAYYYERRLRGTEADPRIYYPSILTDNTGDPTRPAGCTGLAAIAAPQLVLANYSAANHALWLLHHHFIERPTMAGYAKEFMPIKTWNFGPRFLTTRLCDLITKEKAA